MNAEIINVGTELLVGSIVNTNARFIAEALADYAIDTYHQVTVGDNPKRIALALQAAFDRADLVVVTGGLGPTEDDITLNAVSFFSGLHLLYHKPTAAHIRSYLKSRSLTPSTSINRQCMLPKGAIVFENALGTAPGLLVPMPSDKTKQWLIVLPGPPRELEPLLRDKILPEFFRVSGLSREYFIRRSIRMIGLSEPVVASKVKKYLEAEPPLTLGIYTRFGEVELKIMAKSPVRENAVAMADKLEAIIRKKFGSAIYTVGNDPIAAVIGNLLREKKWTLAVAESCTGGLLTSQLTDIPGSSEYFVGGVVAYDNRVKISALGVKPALIEQRGAVSPEVAEAMAEGIRARFHSDIGIAITGIAGPDGGSKQKPVGLVYIALSINKKTFVEKNLFFGRRTDIKHRAALKAMDILRLHLLASGPSPKSDKKTA